MLQDAIEKDPGYLDQSQVTQMATHSLIEDAFSVSFGYDIVINFIVMFKLNMPFNLISVVVREVQLFYLFTNTIATESQSICSTVF